MFKPVFHVQSDCTYDSPISRNMRHLYSVVVKRRPPYCKVRGTNIRNGNRHALSSQQPSDSADSRDSLCWHSFPSRKQAKKHFRVFCNTTWNAGRREEKVSVVFFIIVLHLLSKASLLWFSFILFRHLWALKSPVGFVTSQVHLWGLWRATGNVLFNGYLTLILKTY